MSPLEELGRVKGSIINAVFYNSDSTGVTFFFPFNYEDPAAKIQLSIARLFLNGLESKQLRP